MLKTKRDLTSHIEAYTRDPATTPFGYILSMECGDAVLDPDNIHEWYEMGLRAIGITHYGANRYGGGTKCEVGLALEAIPLLKNIEKLGMALDMTHLSDKAFWQVADTFGGRVLASHQNARKFCDWQRQFSDEQLKFVIKKGGVIGVALDAVMLQPGWIRGVSKPEVTLDRVVENIDHVCQLAGNFSVPTVLYSVPRVTSLAITTSVGRTTTTPAFSASPEARRAPRFARYAVGLVRKRSRTAAKACM